jgi:Protein of unknown function (DUF3108)
MDLARAQSAFFELATRRFMLTRSIAVGMNIVRLCLILALLVSSAGEVRTQQPSPPPKQLPFQIGEELVYKAELSKGLLRSLDVAEFRFAVKEDQITTPGAQKDDPLPVLIFIGEVSSNGFFVRLFNLKFHQRIDSTVDRTAFTVLKTQKVDEQNKRSRASEAIFDHDAHRVTWTERDTSNSSQAPRTLSAEFTEPIQDVVSAIYFLRAQQLEAGKTLEIEVSDSGRVSRIPITVVERKRMKTALGTVFVLRLEPTLFGAQGIVRSEGRFSIWLTDDRRHIPVRAQVKVPAGTFDIKLKSTSYRPATHDHK